MLKLSLHLIIVIAIAFLMTQCSRHGPRRRQVPSQQPTANRECRPLRGEAEAPEGQFNIPFHFSVTEPLDTPFRLLCGAVLAIGTKPFSLEEPLGWPIEPDQRLYIVLRNQIIIINDLAQLRGHVTIETPQEALAFCRLITSPRTYHLWRTTQGKYEAEIVSNDQIDRDFVFGDEALGEALSNAGSGHCGIVSSRQKLDELGIGPAEVRTTPEGYEIRRRLLVEDLDTRARYMAKVVEVVRQDGSYVRTGTHVYDLPSGVAWSFRSFL